MEDQLELEQAFGEYVPPDTSIRFDKLARAIHSAYKAWKPFREMNDALVQSYLGPAYGSTDDKRKVYVNKLRQAVIAYTMLLAANRPQADVTTNKLELRAFCRHFQTALNNLIIEIDLEGTVRRWILDAFFMVGITKLHMKDSGLVELEPDLLMDPGCPFVSNVSLDDFACDVSARKFSEMKWAADMYRIPYASFKEGVEMGMYDRELAEEIHPSSKYETVDGERLERFSRGTETDIDEFEPMVDLCDVWVAREQRIYTFAVTDRRNFSIAPKPLGWMMWYDHDCPPYHLLGFDIAPENIMPVSPAMSLDELNRLINNLVRKSSRQAIRQKDLIVVGEAGTETAKRMQQASDGDIVMGDPSQVTPVKMGGVDNLNQAFTVTALDLFESESGGVMGLMGQGPQADTATQEQIVQAAGNRKIAQMQHVVLTGVRGILRSLGLMLWEDEFKEIAGQIDVAEGITVDATWKPGDREGNFVDYNIAPNVYQMLYRPPVARGQTITGIVQNVVMPLTEHLVAQGGTVDVQKLVEMLAESEAIPELTDIITFQNPLPIEPASTEPAGKSPFTKREYTRTSRSAGPTPAARSAVQRSEWLGQSSSATPQQRPQGL